MGAPEVSKDTIMQDAYICEATRTPIGRFGGALSSVRPDDLLAHVIRALIEQVPTVNAQEIDDVIMGCANQAGEDNRNVARMSALLAELPDDVPGATLNRLCGSGMDAIGTAARAIKAGEVDMIIAGGVESMSRAPFVLPKAETAFTRNAEIYDTTIGWRFVNALMKKKYGVDSMPETAENVAADFGIRREDQDAFALRSQQRAEKAQKAGRFAAEITPVPVPTRKGAPILVKDDEHIRHGATLEGLAKLKTPFRENGSVTAGNASGVNDGAAAMIVASKRAIEQHGLTPRARIVGMATAGVAPRIMGFGPAPAAKKLMEQTGSNISDYDVIELNEAFAAQALAVLRDLGIEDDSEHVNPNGGAIALGHPLGMSGARLVLTAVEELTRRDAERALCTMCIGVGQGIAIEIERV